MNFSDLCKDHSHQAVHYNTHGYMICDLDQKYVYADGRKIIFANPEDQQLYEQKRRRLEAVYGIGIRTFDVDFE